MSSLYNYLLYMEYDGSGYSGWQKQPGAKTVQSEIENALFKLGLKGVEVTAAGRTDKGVHAEMQAVSARFKGKIAKNYDLRYSLNSVLPCDISILSAEKMEYTFNPRYRAGMKIYRYDIWNEPWRSVWNSKNTWHIPRKLNVRSMKEAANYLVGRHNFSAFDASGSTQPNKTARLYRIDIKRSKGKLEISIAGDRFLYKMVRNIVGTFVEVGQGKRLPESVRDVLLSRNRKLAGPTAPSKGLFLQEVLFNEE